MANLGFAVRALRSRNYRLFFSGQIISLIGTWMTRIATSWLVYRLTGSAVLLGIVGFASQIPSFLLGPASHAGMHTVAFHDPVVFAGRIGADGHGEDLGDHPACVVSGGDQRLRYAGAAIVRDPDGGSAGGSGEPHR